MNDDAPYKYYLVNSSGNIQKTKSAAKDGDDWYFYVYKSALKLYTNNKNLKLKSGTSATKADGTSITTGSKWEDYVVDAHTTTNGK